MKRIPAAVRNKAKKIKLLLLDVDGVLTDGRIIIDDRGVESKHFHVRDGQGISLLMHAGIEVGFITARSSRAVSRRAKELGVRTAGVAATASAALHHHVQNLQNVFDPEAAEFPRYVDAFSRCNDKLATRIA